MAKAVSDGMREAIIAHTESEVRLRTILEEPADECRILAIPRLFRGLPSLEKIDFVNEVHDGYDAIAVFGTTHLRSIERLVGTPGGLLIPVACFDESPPEWVDVGVPIDTPADAASGLNTLAAIARRVKALPQPVRTTADPAIALLARMHTRQRPLAATFAPHTPALVSYPTAGLIAGVDEIAHDLVEQGYLSSRFFERLHVCPTCRSSRVNVREECLDCRSSNIENRSLVHHFKCAHQAAESAFLRDNRLVCPKCSETLQHVGLDYDKPGTVVFCRTCGKSDDHSTVGFVCLDCGGARTGEEMPTRDWYSYDLTARGEQAVQTGNLVVHTGPTHHSFSGFQALLRQADREQTYFGTPFTVVSIRFTAAERIRATNERLWSEVRSLALEIIRGVKRDVDVMQEHAGGLLLFMPRCTVRDAARLDGTIQSRLAEVMAEDPEITFDALDREQIMALAEGDL